MKVDLHQTFRAIAVGFSASLLMCSAYAEEFEVGQKNKKFTEVELEINAGDQVKFTNQDRFFHNIYSLSDKNSFDLGSFPKGDHRIIQFDEKGTVEVNCAIHPNMKMRIEVK